MNLCQCLVSVISVFVLIVFNKMTNHF